MADEREALLRRIETRAHALRRTRGLRVALVAGVAATVIVVGATVAVVLARHDAPAQVHLVSPPPTSTDSSIATTPVTCPTPAGKYTETQLEAIRPEVDDLVDRQATLIFSGIGANSILVYLPPAREPLAAQLTDRFGDAVEIEVGGVPYCGAPGVSPPCPAFTGTDALPAGLHLSLQLDHTMIHPTDSVSGVLTIVNDGPDTLNMDPGQPVTALLVRPGTTTVVGHNTGIITGTGLGLRLGPGDQTTIEVVVGTSQCGGGKGSALPPGTYAVRAGIGPNEGPPQYLAPEVPLVVTG